jgi:hypothetical protein
MLRPLVVAKAVADRANARLVAEVAKARRDDASWRDIGFALEMDPAKARETYAPARRTT